MKFGLRIALLLGCCLPALAQPAKRTLSPALARRVEGIRPADRIVGAIDENRRVSVPGTVHTLAVAAFDAGSLAPDRPLHELTLVLQRDPVQARELERLLDEQQDPRSPLYHQWLTPETFGEHFGVSQRDLEATTDWLKSQGFAVDEIAAGRQTILFSGTAGQVEAAFHTALHEFQVDGDTYYGNVTPQEIPQALATVAAGVLALHDFDRQRSKRITVPEIQPDLVSLASGRHYLHPSDFATIYGMDPLYQSGLTGAGRSIGIANNCSVDPAVVAAYRDLVAVPANPVIITMAGTPSATCAPAESYLDVEWSGGIGTGASINLVVAASASTAANYIVQHDLTDIVSVSFESCEKNLAASGNLFYSAMWQQAAAQGITAVVSSGDEGAAGCDAAQRDAPPAKNGLSVNGICSTPYSTCVGGTQFDDIDNPGLYWSDAGWAKGFIPELAWNESQPSGSSASLLLTGGGFSTFYTRPTWQGGTSSRRGVPDVSFSAAGHDPYRACAVLSTCNSRSISAFLGTSASAPAFAGMVSLIVEKLGERQGNINPVLYALAARSDFGPIFHDVTTGDNTVPGQEGYSAIPGWDPVTGIGSVDANALANKWAAALAPKAVFSNQRITTTAIGSGPSCGVPSGSTTLTRAAGTVYLFFNSTVSTGDVLSADFVTPDGEVMSPSNWDIASGFQCYSAGLAVAGLPVTSFGVWQARVFNNGIPVFSVPFTVTGAALAGAPVITQVLNAEGDAPLIAPNTWIALKGTNLAPDGDVRIWRGSDFLSGKLPTSLDGVSVTVNGKSAYVYFISAGQINVLTPPDAIAGAVTVQVTVNGTLSLPAASLAQTLSPGLFIFNGGPYVVATHTDGSLIGPETLYQGLTTAASLGETVVIYGNGFGPSTAAVVSGALTQSGTLAEAPVFKIGGVTAVVSYAALISPGLYQFNVEIPPGLPSGDNSLTVAYGGSSAQAGVVITVR